jgi:S1-C subfamily serine protease
LTRREEEGRLILDDHDPDLSDGSARILISTRTGRPLTADLPSTSAYGLRATLVPEDDGRVSVRLSARRGEFETVEVLAGTTPDIVIVKAFATAAPEPESEPDRTEEIASTSVLRIGARGAGGAGSGSGWVYAADSESGTAQVVTNWHVINGHTEFTAALEGEDPPRAARVVGGAPCWDLALLEVDGAGLEPLDLAQSDDLRVRQEVVILGFPASVNGTTDLVVTDGKISKLNTTLNTTYDSYPNLVRHTAPASGGDSGGPLVTPGGQLVGVHTFSGSGEGENFAIGVDAVREVVPVLAGGRSLAWTGMGLEKTDADDRLLVQGAPPESPAGRAGFGDLRAFLLAVDGVPVEGSRRSYCDAVQETPFGGETGTESVFSLALPDGTTVDVTLTYW